MDESALERFFDKFIANDPSKMEEVEDEDVMKEFCRLLPDELLTLSKDDTRKAEESSTRVHPTSQNPTALVIPQPPIILKIDNVLSTVKLGCSLDLHFIARTAWNVEYKPQTFRGLIMRIHVPRVTAVIYQTGNIVFSGAKSEEQSWRGGRKCVRKLQKLGIPVRFLNFKIHNLHASCKTFPVRLEQLGRHPHCSYEPEMFSGLIYNAAPIGIPSVSVTIFATGKILLTGSKKEADLYKVLDTIVPLMNCYRRL